MNNEPNINEGKMRHDSTDELGLSSSPAGREPKAELSAVPAGIVAALGTAAAIALPLTLLEGTAAAETSSPTPAAAAGDAGDFSDCLDCNTTEDAQNADQINPEPVDRFDTEANCGSCAGRGSCSSCASSSCSTGSCGSCGGCGGCGSCDFGC